MKLWMLLYAMIWIAFLEFLLVMTPVQDSTVLVYVHVVLGIVILVLAFYNARRLVQTTAPARVKRIAQSTAQLAVVAAILGLLIRFEVGGGSVIPLLNISILGIFLFVHVVNAFAIITQAAAVAIAYDMWEDKEFDKETEPGSVPPRPMPSPGAGKT